jgi:hypothetical protein
VPGRLHARGAARWARGVFGNYQAAEARVRGWSEISFAEERAPFAGGGIGPEGAPDPALNAIDYFAPVLGFLAGTARQQRLISAVCWGPGRETPFRVPPAPGWTPRPPSTGGAASWTTSPLPACWGACRPRPPGREQGASQVPRGGSRCRNRGMPGRCPAVPQGDSPGRRPARGGGARPGLAGQAFHGRQPPRPPSPFRGGGPRFGARRGRGTGNP